MRARNLKPGFFKNELLAETTPLGQLLFAGLWCMADREGRLENRPLRMKAELFPYTKVNIIRLLNELAKRGFIVIYGDFIQIEKFNIHQNPHPHEKRSEIPPPKPDKSISDSLSKTEAVTCNDNVITLHGRAVTKNDNVTLNPESPILNPESLKVKDKEAASASEAVAPKPNSPVPKLTPESMAAFKALWKQYPSRIGEKQALFHWRASVVTADDRAAIGVALRNYLESRRVKEGFAQDGCKWFENWRDWIEPPESTPAAAVDKDDPLSKVIRCYKMLRGVDKDDRTWDAGHWADSVNPARRILEVFAGDWRAAVGYMQEQSGKFTADKLSWKLETLEKYADEYKARTSYAKIGS